MLKPLVPVFMATALLASPTIAQDDYRQESIVVTASMIDEGDLMNMPNATLRVRADFVLYELTYVNSTLDGQERKQEMERMYKAVLKQLPKHSTISLRAGDASASAAIETTTFDEVYTDYGNQGRLSFVVKAAVGPNDTYLQLRERVEAFVASAGEVGRSQSILDDEQYLGVQDLKVHRPALLAAIWADLSASANPAGVSELDVEGLERRTRYHPVGPLELELYIPYKVTYETTLER